MNDPGMRRPSMTEDTPAAPGWVEGELDGILAEALPSRPTLGRARTAYLDCLAGSAGPGDAEEAHDRCRRRFLQALREDGVAEETVAQLDRRLAALEAELATRT